jgi:ABC-type glycerol-3-phosphate transport system substrate-binding protein
MTKNLRKVDLTQTGRMIVASLLLAVVVLAGCQGQSILDAVFPQQDEAYGISELSSKPLENATEEEIPMQEASEFIDLTVWIPQQFDPASESESAMVIYDRFQEFSDNNLQVNLNVRIKPSTGPGSIIETLTSASMVAPEAMPSLILISRSDLVQAASKNLLVPIGGLSGVMDGSDWFDVARELGIYEGTFYCAPFAANALGLVYKHSGFNSDQPTWEEVIRQSEKLIFASGDPEALTTIALYQSAGGVLTDESGQSGLDLDALTSVLSAYAIAAKNDRISGSVIDYQTDDQIWNALLSSSKSSALTWANHALAEPNTFKLAMLPSLGDEPFTLSGGWLWCMTEPHEQDRINSIALAEFLVDPDFLALWAPLSGYLPVRPSTIPGFEGVDLQNTISKILMSAHVRPDKSQITEIGAEIKLAISEVLQQQNSPETSALNTIKRLEAMNTQ